METRLSGSWKLVVVLGLLVPLVGAPLLAYGDGVILQFVGETGGTANDAAVQGNYAYVVSEWDNGRVFDVSDPENPVQVGSWDVGQPTGIQVAGSYAYVTDVLYATDGLTVVNISDPANPDVRGTCGTPYHAVDVAVVGDLAYVADLPDCLVGPCQGGGLWVIDVSDPDNPTDLGFYDSPGWPGHGRSVAADPPYVYLADGDAGLRVVNVANASNPAEVGFYDTPGTANGVDLAGGYAYVADMGGGVRVLDVSDPENPSEVASYSVPGDAHSVTVAGPYAFVTDDAEYVGGGVYLSDGLWVLDISDPAAPALVATYDTPGWSYVTTVAGGYVYVAEGGDPGGEDVGVLILRLVEHAIDIMPGNPLNPINYESMGKIRVAILSSSSFDAVNDVDQASITFGRTGDEDSLAFCEPAGKDVNQDGLADLACHFHTQLAGFQCGDDAGILKATADGLAIEVSDPVWIVPCKP